jgi:hypothetical protein
MILAVNGRGGLFNKNKDDSNSGGGIFKKDDDSGGSILNKDPAVELRLGLNLGDSATNSALTVSPSTVGTESVLQIAELKRMKKSDSNPNKFSSGDCLVFRFDPIAEHPDYVPIKSGFD